MVSLAEKDKGRKYERLAASLGYQFSAVGMQTTGAVGPECLRLVRKIADTAEGYNVRPSQESENFAIGCMAIALMKGNAGLINTTVSRVRCSNPHPQQRRPPGLPENFLLSVIPNRSIEKLGRRRARR